MKFILRALIWPIWWLSRDYYEAKERWQRKKANVDLCSKLFSQTNLTVENFDEPEPRFFDYCPLTKRLMK